MALFLSLSFSLILSQFWVYLSLTITHFTSIFQKLLPTTAHPLQSAFSLPLISSQPKNLAFAGSLQLLCCQSQGKFSLSSQRSVAYSNPESPQPPKPDPQPHPSWESLCWERPEMSLMGMGKGWYMLFPTLPFAAITAHKSFQPPPGWQQPSFSLAQTGSSQLTRCYTAPPPPSLPAASNRACHPCN